MDTKSGSAEKFKKWENIIDKLNNEDDTYTQLFVKIHNFLHNLNYSVFQKRLPCTGIFE